ncbi:MAG: hypothetical protein B1H12_11215 [Desulfobacteraceae bacterium 4484_190.2]|nr:MAG: hypothetical protein B1H12_11215 [Desulfobacteraceae bacterium 4484_190.2]
MNKLLTEQEVAELTGLSLSTLRMNRSKGKGIPYLKIGKCVRYNMEDLKNYLESKKIIPAGN